MKKILLTTLIAAPLLCTNVSADTTFGIGMGSMYNGFGINFGRTNSASLTFGALGCMGWSYSSGSSSGSDGAVINSESSHETNCGVGLGFISSTLLPGNRQGVGLSLGVNYNTDKRSGTGAGTEWSLMPSYTYFLNGISERGLNLGLGPRLTYQKGELESTNLIFNVGFQF